MCVVSLFHTLFIHSLSLKMTNPGAFAQVRILTCHSLWKYSWFEEKVPILVKNVADLNIFFSISHVHWTGWTYVVQGPGQNTYTTIPFSEVEWKVSNPPFFLNYYIKYSGIFNYDISIMKIVLISWYVSVTVLLNVICGW